MQRDDDPARYSLRLHRESHELFKGISNTTNFTITFYTGRVDRVNCTRPASGNPLPDAEGGSQEIVRTLMSNLGFDVEHTVALMGAHTLGGANASGYNGTWKDRPDLFTTQFFKELLVQSWVRGPMRNPTTGKATLQQWNVTNTSKSSRNANNFMLNTDMAMVFDVAGNVEPALEASLPKTCPSVFVGDSRCCEQDGSADSHGEGRSAGWVPLHAAKA